MAHGIRHWEPSATVVFTAGARPVKAFCLLVLLLM
jgi:hypothetical protein